MTRKAAEVNLQTKFRTCVYSICSQLIPFQEPADALHCVCVLVEHHLLTSTKLCSSVTVLSGHDYPGKGVLQIVQYPWTAEQV